MPKNAKVVKAIQGSDQLPGKEKGLYQDAMVSITVWGLNGLHVP